MPHGHCYLWTSGLVWLHVVSDALIVLAYYSIPVTLLYFVRKRADVDFGWIFVFFAAFILACGTTHLLEIWNVWHSYYWLSGAVKAFTALASIVTAALLVRLIPVALALPSPAALVRANALLGQEVHARRAAEEYVRDLNGALETRVAERTAEVNAANAALQRQNAEAQSIHERIRWLASIPEQNPNPIAEFDLDTGALCYANPAALRHIPHLERDGLGHPSLTGVRSVASERGSGLPSPVNLEAAFGKAYYTMTATFLPGSGRVRLYCADITARKQVEESLQLQANLLDQSYDAILVWEVDGVIRFWNRGAASLYGFTRDEAVGRVSHELLHTAGLAGPVSLVIAALVRDGRWEGELRHTARDGRQFTVETRMVLVTENGRRLVLEANRDITGRKLAGEAAARLAAIVESSDDAIVGKDLRGIVTSWNGGAERLFGYSAAEMVGQSITRLIPADRQQEETEFLARISLGESVRHFETVRVRKDGGMLNVSVTVSVIRDSSGRVVGASKVARDITEQKEAGETIRRLNAELEERVAERTAQLEAANRELEAFSYSVSHDLRTPLRAMDGFSQAVLEDFGPALPAEGRRYLETIRQAAQKMGRLIDDLLCFSRLSRAPLNKQLVNTAQLVRDVLDDLQSEQEGRQIDLRIGELSPCTGDTALLKQVFQNLLSNAFKYTRKRDAAVVEIGCEVAPERTVYFVRDNGTGFDMRYVDKLFGVFQRLHRAEEYEGTGVGLALVQRIISRHGGHVWADAAIDRGATFYFTLEGAPRYERNHHR